MGTAELSKRTTINIQEKANLIWAIADKLVGTYKPHEYGNVILPMCVIKRFSDTLIATKEKVYEKNKQLDERGIVVKDGFLRTASGHDFYNTSAFTSFTTGGFDDTEQIRLRDFCKEIDVNNSMFVTTNSDPQNVDSEDKFFDELYEMFNIKRVSATRMINSKKDGRGAISEIMISNVTSIY